MKTELKKGTPEYRAYMQQLGSLGGKKTAQTYGLGYMRSLGCAGFDSFCKKYHDGNRAKAANALIGMGKPFGATSPRGRVHDARLNPEQVERY